MSLGKVEMDIGFVNNFIDECMEREDLKLVGIQKLSNPVIDIPLTVKITMSVIIKSDSHEA